jgi:hypothetical protein
MQMPVNPLAPAPSANPSLGQGADPAQALGQQHEMAGAQLKKLDTMAELMHKTRTELDSLVKLGDLVEEEDVIRAVGKIVAAGGSPMPLASMLADAPFGNREALQSWISSKDANIRQIEQKLQAAKENARHQVMTSALQVVMNHPALQGPPVMQQQGLEEQTEGGGLGQATPRADGGPVNPGSPYLVGERGPEVMVPGFPGQVLPNDFLNLVLQQYDQARLGTGNQDRMNPSMRELPAQPQSFPAISDSITNEIEKAGGIKEFTKQYNARQKLPRE